MRSKYGKLFWAVLLSSTLSSIPQIVFAEVQGEMIATTAVVESLTRTQAEERVRGHLQRQDLQNELLKLGLSPDEVSSRLASLSTSELNRMADQMDEARYGGDLFGVLVLVLLVVLIVYLVKRI